MPVGVHETLQHHNWSELLGVRAVASLNVTLPVGASRQGGIIDG